LRKRRTVSDVEIVLCGEPQVRYQGHAWRFRVPSAGWLLLTLLTMSRRPIARDLLAATLWPDDDRLEGLTKLRRHVHMIAQALPPSDVPWIAGTNKTIAWNPESRARVDVNEFERALADHRDADAVEAYRGDLLPHSFEDSIVAERERLRTDYLNALERLIDASLESRELTQTVAYAERMLAVDEWREDAVRGWMAAKYESGNGSAALAAYERLAKRLAEDFSAAPAAQTTALRDLIAAGSPLPKRSQIHVDDRAVETQPHLWRQRFVGRTEPLDRLNALWSRAARGSGGIAFISGDAGIGKSRLASEFAARVRASGGRVIAGSTSNPENEPYESAATALRSALDPGVAAVGNMWLASLARIIPEIHGLCEGLSGTDAHAGEGARERLFEAIARTLEYLGRRQPLCVLLEDVHWAGPATVDLLATLSRRLGTMPVVLVATYREDAPSSGLARDLRLRLVKERRAIACPLERLSEREVAEIIDAEILAADATVRESVAIASNGNPLFAAQLIANYLESGAPTDGASIPESVGDAIAARVRRLDADARAIAEMAATIGESFRADVLAAAGGWDENAVLDALSALMDRGIVRESGGTLEYVFAHGLFATTFYAESPRERRTARHRRIATVLGRDGGDDAGGAASIARHWDLAGEGSRAAQAYLRAAQHAVELVAYDEALTHCARALELGLDEESTRTAFLVREAVHGRQARRDEQRADLIALDTLVRDDSDEAFAWEISYRKTLLARATDDLAREAELLASLNERAIAARDPMRVARARTLSAAYSFAVNDKVRAREAAGEAIALFESVADEPGEVETLCLLARMEAAWGDLQATQRHLDRARARTRTNDRIAMLNATMAAAHSAHYQQHFRTTAALATASLEICREIGYKEREGDACNLIGIALTRTGDFAGAREALANALSVFAAMGRTFGVGAARLNAGILEWRLGNLQEAYDQTSESRAIMLALRHVGSEIVATANLAGICNGLGRHDEAIALAQTVLSLARANEQSSQEAVALLVLGTAHRSLGSVANATEYLEAGLAIHRHREIHRPVDILETLAELSLTYLAAGKNDAALALVEELLAASDEALHAALWPQLFHWSAARVYHGVGDEGYARRQLHAAATAVTGIASQIQTPQEKAAFAALPLNQAIARARRGDWP
jgi:DNA-binding SARP family transcriptional activator